MRNKFHTFETYQGGNNNKNFATMEELENKGTQTKPELYTLLAPVLNPKVSKRCGKGSCDLYNKHNKISGCKHFEDRRECSKSIKQRNQSANTSKKKPNVNWYGC